MPTDRESGISCLGTVSHSMRLPASSNSVPWPSSEFLQPSCQVKKGVTHAGLHGWHATQLAQKPVPSSGPWGSFCLMKSTPCLGFADCFLSSQMLSEWTAPPYWVKQIFTFAPDFRFRILLLITIGDVMKVPLPLNKFLPSSIERIDGSAFRWSLPL